jgi:hypothetical protein
MAQESEIVFNPFNFDDQSKKGQIQYTTTCNKLVNGITTMADEETGFMFHKYSGYASAKFITDPEKRDFIKVSINPEEQACVDLENTINLYDNKLNESRQTIFGKFNKLYTHVRSIKEPRAKDDLDEEINGDADKPQEPRLNSMRFKLDMVYRYYYNGERLDYKNSMIVQKDIKTALATSKDKSIINTLSYTLKFKDEEGKFTNRVISNGELEQRKEIGTKVFFRRPETVQADAKPISECTEDELVQYYGEAEQQDVRSPDDMDKFYRHGSYVRFMYSPQKIWAMKNKDDNGNRKFSIQWVCKQIDIIHIKTQTNTQTFTKSKYGEYAFGKGKQAAVDQMSIKEDNTSGKAASSKSSKVAAQAAQAAPAPSKTVIATATKNVKKVESEDEDEDEEEEEKDEVEEDDEEEEEEEEEEVVTITTKGKKTIETKQVSKSSKPAAPVAPVARKK